MRSTREEEKEEETRSLHPTGKQRQTYDRRLATLMRMGRRERGGEAGDGDSDLTTQSVEVIIGSKEEKREGEG